jgi:hypothetical protein
VRQSDRCFFVCLTLRISQPAPDAHPPRKNHSDLIIHLALTDCARRLCGRSRMLDAPASNSCTLAAIARSNSCRSIWTRSSKSTWPIGQWTDSARPQSERGLTNLSLRAYKAKCLKMLASEKVVLTLAELQPHRCPKLHQIRISLRVDAGCFLQQFRQLGDVRRDPAPLVARGRRP